MYHIVVQLVAKPELKICFYIKYNFVPCGHACLAKNTAIPCDVSIKPHLHESPNPDSLPV